MTVIAPIGRAISWQAIPRSTGLLTRLNTNASALRLYKGAKTESKPAESTNTCYSYTLCLNAARTFATKATSRPKAHTGRSTTARPTASTKKSTTSKSRAKKKPVKKVKAKAKPKSRPKKKTPTAAALKRAAVAKRRDVRTRALLTEPKKLPDNAWAVYFSENKAPKGTEFSLVGQYTKEVASRFRNISAEEHERLNHTANQNKAENEKAYKRWVSQYTPSEIKAANAARNQIALQKQAAGKNRKKPRNLIKDERLVKRPVSSFAHFQKARHASGDFKHMTIKEAAGVLAKQWASLSSTEKQQYIDEASADKKRYIEEHTNVYGSAPRTK